MKALSTLKRSLAKAAKWRGHSLRWHEPFGRANGPKSQFCHCRKCGKEGIIIQHPAPNQIDISGEVVALNCEG